MDGQVFGVCMVKDEDDVIGGTISHLLEEDVDGIIIADNGSTDGTRDLLADLAATRPVFVTDDPEVGYYQSRKMTALAFKAVERGAEWIVPFDADELWFDHVDHLATSLRKVDNDFAVVEVPLFNHFVTDADVAAESPFERMVYRQTEPGALPKVCFRWRGDAVIEQGNHAVTFQHGMDLWRSVRLGVELRHFPYRSFEQFCRKAANGFKAYAATDLPDYQGAHWRQYGQMLVDGGPEALRPAYDKWFAFKSPLPASMLRDPAPYRRWRHS